MKISYGITVYCENEDLKKMLNLLISTIDPEDEIIVLSDSEHVTDEVLTTINFYIQQSPKIKHISYPICKNFSQFKNKLLDHATGEYIFSVGCDELPNIEIVKDIKQIILSHPDNDSFFFSRVNKIIGTPEEIKRFHDWSGHSEERAKELGDMIADPTIHPDWQNIVWKLNQHPRLEFTNLIHHVLINTKNPLHVSPENGKYVLNHHTPYSKWEHNLEFFNTIEPYGYSGSVENDILIKKGLL